MEQNLPIEGLCELTAYRVISYSFKVSRRSEKKRR